MKLSTKGRYGIRAMYELALEYGKGPLSIKEIAARQSIPEAYLEQLVLPLKREGLVTATRGASGGYRLSRPPKETSVGAILRALEGSLDAVKCPGLEEENSCDGSEFCVTKYVWQKINDSINRTVDEMKLDQLVEESRSMKEEAGTDENTSCCI